MVDLLSRKFIVERDGELRLDCPGLRSGQEVEVTIRLEDKPGGRSSELFLESIQRMHSAHPEQSRPAGDIDEFFRTERDSWKH